MPQENTEPSDSLGQLLDVLTKEVYLGRMHLWIWRHLNNALVQEPEVAKTSRVFFRLTLRAHAHEAFMHLARLFDKRRHAVTLRSLFGAAHQYAAQFQKTEASGVRCKLLPELETRLEQLRPRVGPVLARRNSILAHLDPKAVTDLATVLKESEITVGELESLYDQAGDLVNTVSGAYRNSQTLMQLVGWDDFENVIRFMKRGTQAELEDFEKKWPRSSRKDSQ